MASAKSISKTMKSASVKKENLRKAFEDLQSHSSSLASFTLQWKDLEDHFSSIEKSLENRLKELESKETHQSKEKPPVKESKSTDPVPRPELKSFCVKMDGQGLRSFIIDHRKDLDSIRNEVAPALRSASDPAKLVLDSMDGFLKSKGDNDLGFPAIRRTCILLLEKLLDISPEIKNPLKEKAKKLAVEWKGKIGNGDDGNPLEILGFLQLLVTYGLVSAFETDELLDLVAVIARRKEAIDLCRGLGVSEKIPDFVRKLISKGKRLEAVNFAYAFNLVDKFPPVPLLKDFLKGTKKTVQEVRKKGKNSTASQNEAIAKEIAALKTVIKIIEEHNLESEYSHEGLEKRVAQLEKLKVDRKRERAPPTVAASKPQQQPGNKRPRPDTSAASAAARAVLPQSQLHLSDRVPSYIGSTGPYGLAGSSTLYDRPVSSFLDSPLGYGGARSPPRSHLYSSDPLMTSGSYDKPMGYGSYPFSSGLPPPYRPSFFP
eukprot:TRINITY_DN14238_c0_g1_i1.p1 TRINITY_DN14238_c0_g1~~TRINITY_DN14238_c0_g1_i1.p1  ORF type:complete len:488 (+),score=98.74 TRINITY_DN14238_c0_g1_i1:173-1636(+)